MYNLGWVHVHIYRASWSCEVCCRRSSRGSAEEKPQAAETYVSYCGRYEFRGDTVIHHVALSSFPNWVGVDQERLVKLNGNRLTLSTRPILLGGIEQTAHLNWERV